MCLWWNMYVLPLTVLSSRHLSMVMSKSKEKSMKVEIVFLEDECKTFCKDDNLGLFLIFYILSFV